MYPKGIIQIQTMNLSLLLFLVGILGFILNRKNDNSDRINVIICNIININF